MWHSSVERAVAGGIVSWQLATWRASSWIVVLSKKNVAILRLCNRSTNCAVIGVASINPTADSRPHIALRVRLELDLEQALHQDAIRWGKTLASPPKLAILLAASSCLISKCER